MYSALSVFGLARVLSNYIESCDVSPINECSHLVMEVRRGGSQDTAVGFEHMSLDVDGEVTEPSVFSLSVQTIQHRRLSAGEAHLDHRA